MFNFMLLRLYFVSCISSPVERILSTLTIIGGGGGGGLKSLTKTKVLRPKPYKIETDGT